MAEAIDSNENSNQDNIWCLKFGIQNSSFES